jgi:hypothetical protein
VTVVNNELKGTWKEEVVSQFKIPSPILPLGSEESHEIAQVVAVGTTYLMGFIARYNHQRN